MSRIILKSFAVAIFAIATMSVQVNAASTKTQGEKNLESMITKNIVNQHRDFKNETEAIVRVTFTVNKEGKIQIMEYNSSNTALFDYVQKQLQRENIYNAEELENKVFCYEFKFIAE
ncbi:MAG: hypothetical protein IPP29_14430 [Bacteroidetes bacterium]|nr:hypothetical protein [Bacteroidota bacterium]MBL0052609.1 hypothetical protein [Bacteroidota bacterium]